ncbi:MULTISPECIES: hypothetical protein [unclassified Psychrosphaera]
MQKFIIVGYCLSRNGQATTDFLFIRY